LPVLSLLVKTGVIEYNHLMQRTGQRGAPSENMAVRIRDLGLRKEDIIEKFIRSAGKGGQNVNKTSTCVYLKHLPTGIEVKCQQERSQAMNRVAALGLLAQKIAEAALQVKQERKQAREKERRRKRPRPYRLKQNILETKKKTGEKKRLRAKKFEE
jgi:protein subunit release factor B